MANYKVSINKDEETKYTQIRPKGDSEKAIQVQIRTSVQRIIRITVIIITVIIIIMIVVMMEFIMVIMIIILIIIQ
jgi:hypothetical protein